MWGQIFGPSGQLGGAFAQPSAVQASFKGAAAEAAAAVRQLAQKRVDAAWSKLEEELGVQKLVWESQSLTPAKAKDRSFQDKIAALRSNLEGALSVRAQDTHQALQNLKQVLQIGDQNGESSSGAVLSNSVTNAAHNVITQERTFNERRRLAEALEAAGIQAVPSGGVALRETEAMVVKCELREPKLERKVREVLSLPLPTELGPAVTGAKTSSKMSAVSGAKMSSKMGGAVGPKQSSSGTAVTKKSSSVRSQSLGGAVAVTSSKMSSRPQGAAAGPEGIKSDLPPGLKAKQAAEKVRDMATKKIDAAWKHLEEEITTQKLVWESVALTKAKDKAYLDNVASITAKFEKVLNAKAYSLHGLFELEQFLQMTPLEQELLGYALLNTARDVVKQEHAREARMHLASALTIAAGPRGPPQEAEAKRELQTLLRRCELGDERFERNVRQALLLEKAKVVELGAPVSAAKVSSSLYSDVTGLCENDTAVAAARAAPRKPGPGRRAESVGSPVKAKKPSDGRGPDQFHFQPQKRIIMEL